MRHFLPGLCLSGNHKNLNKLVLSLIFPFVVYSNSVFAESALIHLGPFIADQSSEDPALAELIKNQLRARLQAAGYQVDTISGGGIAERISGSKSTGASLLIEGYYRPSGPRRNLTVYGVIYNVQSGYLIDAVSIRDEIESLTSEGVRFNADEIKEPDDRRIGEFLNRLVVQIRSNPRFVEARENIAENIITQGLEQRYSIPIRREDVTQEASEVFNLLASQVTTSSTKVAVQAIEAPNLVDIISGREITDYGWQSINDILYHLPGFAPSMDYDRRTVSSRGMFEGWNNNHYLLLMDGVPVNDMFYGSAYTSEITPVSIIKSLEVIRGPGSALYGSNATNGVITIHTYSGEDLGGRIVTRARVGDYGTQIYDITTGNKGKYFSYVLTYNDYRTNGNSYSGLDGSLRTDTFGYLQKFNIRDNRDSSYFMAKIEGEDFLKGLVIQYHRQYWNFQTGHGWIWHAPDFAESMFETMQNIFVSYSGKIGDKFSQEYVVRYQRHDIDWNTRYAENGSFGAFYPTGASEYLKTGADQIFSRAQWTYTLPTGGSVLGGMEGSVFKYSGDREHYANFNARDAAGGFPPFADNAYHPLGPWLEWIRDRNIPTYSFYGQVVSGKLFDKHLEATLGARYDEESVRFRGIDQPYNDALGLTSAGLPQLMDIPNAVNGYSPYYLGYPTSALGAPFQPVEHRTFRRTNPRAGIVFFATKNFSVKALTGKAFRAPSITELFGANTFSLASNPRKLKPELIRTSELALDWIINRWINVRANVFKTRFENQIAYSTQNNNLSSNIYTLSTHGAEAELLFAFKSISGFLNYSYNKRDSETIQDNTIARSPNRTTWAPAQTATGGFRWTIAEKFLLSVSAEHQGKVYRRTSDFGVIDTLTGIGPFTDKIENGGVPVLYNYTYPTYRTESVKAWTSMNVRLVYKITEESHAGFSISNATQSRITLIKNNNYPFDYQMEGRRVLFDLTVTL